MRIALSPATRRGLVGRIEALDERAEALNVNVSTFKPPSYGGGWRVIVRSAKDLSRYVELRGAGPLDAVLAGALDDYEEAFLFTAEELQIIQAQSV